MIELCKGHVQFEDNEIAAREPTGRRTSQIIFVEMLRRHATSLNELEESECSQGLSNVLDLTQISTIAVIFRQISRLPAWSQLH